VIECVLACNTTQLLLNLGAGAERAAKRTDVLQLSARECRVDWSAALPQSMIGVRTVCLRRGEGGELCADSVALELAGVGQRCAVPTRGGGRGQGGSPK